MQRDSRHFVISITTATIVRALCVGAFLYLLFVLRDIALVFLASIVIASFMEAIANTLQKYKIPRLLTIVSLYLAGFAALFFLLYTFVPVLSSELSTAANVLARYMPQDRVDTIIDPKGLKTINQFIQSIYNTVPASQVASSTRALVANMSGGIFEMLSYFFGGFANFVIVVVLSFYLSIQENGIETFLRTVLPFEYEVYIVDLWRRTTAKIALWIHGQMFLAVVMGLAVFIFLSILKIEYALLLAIITLFCELIPFGMIFATIPAVFAAFEIGDVKLAVIVLVGYFVLQQLENYILMPLVNKRMVGMSPVVVILAILIGAKLAGFWGVLLAMPIAIGFLEVVRDLEKKKEELRAFTE